MKHIILLRICEAAKLGVLVKVLVQGCAEYIDLAALSNRAVERRWLTLNLLMKPPMSNIEV